MQSRQYRRYGAVSIEYILLVAIMAIGSVVGVRLFISTIVGGLQTIPQSKQNVYTVLRQEVRNVG